MAWSGLFDDVLPADKVAGTGHALVGNKVNRSAAGRAITVSLKGRGGQQLRALMKAYFTGTPTVTAEIAERVKHPTNVLTDPGAFGARQGANAVENVTIRAGQAATATETARLNSMLDEATDAAFVATDKSGNGLGGKAGKI